MLGLCTRLRDSAFKRSLAELPVGADVDVEDPKGTFLLPEETDRPYVFVAGGIGITVFRCMLLCIHENGLAVLPKDLIGMPAAFNRWYRRTLHDSVQGFASRHFSARLRGKLYGNVSGVDPVRRTSWLCRVSGVGAADLVLVGGGRAIAER